MDITFINYKDNLYRTKTFGRYIAEYYRDSSNDVLFHVQLYDPEKNAYIKVMPAQKKTDVIDVIDCIWNSRCLYYAGYEMQDRDHIEFSVYRYSPDDNSQQVICTFIDTAAVLNGTKRIKIFVLNETILLLQGEVQRDVVAENKLGNIEFNLSLYNIETYEETLVSEANFLNNGIDTIVPVSDSRIMVKTGYSYLEDDRLEPSQKDEAFIESVYLTTVAKLIADITLETDSVDMNLIESAYLESHITRPKITGNYTHFTIINDKTKTTKCVFFNNNTEEQIEYTISSIDYKDLYITYVINNIPYVRLESDTAVSFVNLKKAEIDVSFYDGQIFDAQLGSLFILSSEKNNSMRIYAYPKLKLLAKEHRVYFLANVLDDKYYIYC